MFPFCACARMVSCFSHVRLFATVWTAAHQAPLSMGFYRQEYWSRVPLPSLADGYISFQNTNLKLDC